MNEPPSEVKPLIELYFAGDRLSEDDMKLFLQFIDETYRELGGAGLKIVEAQTLVPRTKD
ncbi:MAG: hypothetical protein ACJ8C4_05685 [Gemmataceae bacterium]